MEKTEEDKSGWYLITPPLPVVPLCRSPSITTSSTINMNIKITFILSAFLGSKCGNAKVSGQGICTALAVYLLIPGRVTSQIAHIILLIYQLARSPWNNAVSGIMIATLFAVVACIIARLAVFCIFSVRMGGIDGSLTDHGTRVISSLVQTGILTGLLVAYIDITEPWVALIAVHSINL